jgi:hypothetical protein
MRRRNAATALLLTACSSFGADSTTGAPADGGPDGAPPPAGEAGPAAPGAPFCASQTGYVFCSDFDDGKETGWSRDPFEVGSDGRGDVAVTPGAGVGGTPGLRFQLASSLGGPKVVLWHALPVSAPESARYTLELDVYLTQFDDTYAVLGGFWLSTQSAPIVQGAAITYPGAFAIRGLDNQALTPPQLIGTWHHLAFELVPAPVTNHDAVLTLGVNKLTLQGQDLVGVTGADVAIGNFYGSGLTAADYVIDDVIVRVR